MGDVNKEKKRVKLLFGILAKSEEMFAKVERRIEYDYGEIERRSPIIPFTYTDYYNAEMGENILRRWISCKDLIFQNELPEVKLDTNKLELLFKPKDSASRCVNIDPGVIYLDKLILATTKNYTHRIYMSDGIYGEITLNYKKNHGYAPNHWTYADYKDPKNIEFFNLIRDDFKFQTEPQAE